MVIARFTMSTARSSVVVISVLLAVSTIGWVAYLMYNRDSKKPKPRNLTIDVANRTKIRATEFLDHPTTLDKANFTDPLSDIEHKIFESEISPVVRRLDATPSVRYQSLVIGIAGGSGSGKTTLSRAVVDALGRENIAYISHDSYYKDLSHLSLSEREQTNFDDPAALDTDLLIEHVKLLKKRKSAKIPIYDFATHSRTNKTELLHPRPIILIEGILIFGDIDLVQMMDIKIFVDTDDDIRLIRRMERDVIERGRSVQNIISQYLKTVRPMHLQHVQPSKKNADIIVPHGLNSVALDLLISKLKRVLSEAETLNGMKDVSLIEPTIVDAEEPKQDGFGSPATHGEM